MLINLSILISYSYMLNQKFAYSNNYFIVTVNMNMTAGAGTFARVQWVPHKRVIKFSFLNLAFCRVRFLSI